MSAAEVGLGGPSAPRWGATLVARLHAVATRLRSSVARFLEADDGSLAAWAAAFAAAPQAVPNLPLPSNKRLTRLTIGLVVAAHVVLLVVVWLRSAPPPPPPGEMTVELVREEPKPEPKPAAKPEQPPSRRPVQEGKDAGAKDKATQTKPAQSPPKPEEKAKPEQQAKQDKPKPEEKKPEPPKEQQKPEPKPKAEPRQPKAAHQRQAHRAPPQPKPQQQAEQKPAPEEPQHQQQPEQPRPEQQIAMPAVALPGASETGTDAVSYSQLVLSQVAKAKKQGRYMGVPGYAGVRFRVADDGSLEMVKLVVSSGDPTLDIEAEAMIRRAAPFPKPPPGGRRDYGITLVFAAQP